MYQIHQFSEYEDRQRCVLPSSLPDECVPDQSLTPQQIMDKFTRGNLPNIQRSPLANDTDGVPVDQQSALLDGVKPIDPFADILDVYSRAKESADMMRRFRSEVAENAKKRALSSVDPEGKGPDVPLEPAPAG